NDRRAAFRRSRRRERDRGMVRLARLDASRDAHDGAASVSSPAPSDRRSRPPSRMRCRVHRRCGLRRDGKPRATRDAEAGRHGFCSTEAEAPAADRDGHEAGHEHPDRPRRRSSAIEAKTVIVRGAGGHCSGMWTRPILRALGFALAAMHLLPAKKHLALFLEHFSFGEAWKGFGAVLAVAVLVAPGPLWRSKWRGLVFGVLAVVHAVPAYDHVPRYLAAGEWADAWRGFGALLALAFFLAPIRIARFSRWGLPLAILIAGCSQRNGAQPDGGADDGGASAACPPCVSDNDCNGGLCAQVGGDSYCTPVCPNGNECSSDRMCVSAMTSSGQTANVCATTSGQCAATIDDAG